MDYRMWYVLMDASLYMRLGVDTTPLADMVWCVACLHECLRDEKVIPITTVKARLVPPSKPSPSRKTMGVRVMREVFGICPEKEEDVGEPREMLSETAKTNVRDYSDTLLKSSRGMRPMNPAYPLWSNRRILTEMLLAVLLRGGDASLDVSHMEAILRGYWCSITIDVPGVPEKLFKFRTSRGEYRFSKEYGARVFYGRGPRRREVVVHRYEENSKTPINMYGGSPYHEWDTPIAKYLNGDEGYFCCKGTAVTEVLDYISRFP